VYLLSVPKVKGKFEAPVGRIISAKELFGIVALAG